MLRIFRHYISGLGVVLFLGDLLVILGVFVLTEVSAIWVGSAPFLVRFLEVGALTAFMLHLGDLYAARLAVSPRELLARLLICQSVSGLMIAAIGFAAPSLRLGRSAFLQITILTTLGLMGWRMAVLMAWPAR